MKTMHAHLRLSTSPSDRTRERCPDVVFVVDEEEIDAIRTDTEQPHVPLEDGALDTLVLHDDALSRVIDEEAWLQEFARVLNAGGELRLTLPAAGMLAWIDPMNAYRYVTDVSKRGDEPNAALPTGWNRHYPRAGVRALLHRNGFKLKTMKHQNHVADEARFLLGLIRDNWLQRHEDAERQLYPRFGRRNPDSDASMIGTTWSVNASKN